MSVNSILKIQITLSLLVGAWPSRRLTVEELSRHDFNGVLLYIPVCKICHHHFINFRVDFLFTEAKMGNNETIFKIPFIIFLNQILHKLGLPAPNFEVIEITENLFCAYSHINGIIDDETLIYRGRCCNDKTQAEEEAARTTIQELKKIYNYHIDDLNFEDYQRAQGNFEDLQILYEQLLNDYRKMENKLKTLNEIEGTGSSTNNC